MAPQLSRQQGKFLAALYNNLRENGQSFDPQFLKGWLIAENPAGATSTPQHGNQNWLNIGNTDSKFYGQGGAYSNPGQAGKNTARWLRGEWSMPGFGRAAGGIVAFSRTAGRGRQAQIDALQSSGWASSGYPNLESIVAGAGRPGFLKYAGNAPQLGRPQQSVSVRLPDTLKLREQRVFDSAAYTRATRAFQLGQILQNQPKSPFASIGASPRGTDSGSNPLLQVLPKAPPAPEDFIDATTSLERVAGRKLPVHGLAASTDAKDNPSSGPAKALTFAANRLGTSETMTNRGGKIDAWQRSFGMLAQPWCGIFVGKALQAAGVQGIDSRIAATSAIYDMAQAGTGGFRKGLVPPSQVRAGDVVVWNPGDFGHTGIVERVKGDGTIVTIEGNASNSVRRNVHKKDGAFYARPNYPSR